MAESSFDFTLTIPVELDFTNARQQARSELSAIAGSGTPSRGQGVSPGTGYSAGVTAAEQAAVDRAMGMAQERSARIGGGYNAGAGAAAVGGFSASARLDTVQAEASLRRLQGQWQALRAEIEGTPLRPNISGIGAPGAVQGIALPAAIPVSSVMGIPVTGPGGANNLPAIAAAAQARAASQSQSAAASSRSTSFRSFGRVLAIAHEVLGFGRMVGDFREGNAAARLGETAEERNAALAQAYYQANQENIVARAFDFIPDLIDNEFSAGHIQREAKQALGVRRMYDIARRDRIAASVGAAGRAGYARRGEEGLAAGRVIGERDAALAETEDQLRELRQRLGELPAGSAERSGVLAQVAALGLKQQEVRDAADFQMQQIRRGRDDALLAFEVRQSRSTAIISGADERTVRLKGIEGEGQLRRRKLVEERGEDLGGKMADTLLRGDVGEEEIEFQRNRLRVNEDLQHAIRQTRFRRGGPGFRLDAQFDDIVTATGQAARELEQQGMEDEAAWQRRLGRLQLSGARDDYLRSFRYQEVSGNRFAGSVDIGDVDKKLRDAQAEIDKGGGAGGFNAEQLKAKIDQIAGYLATIASGYKPARVG